MPPRRQRVGLRRFIIACVVSVMVCALGTVVAALVFSPRIVRTVYLNKLCSDDEAERQRGLKYLVRHIRGDDPVNPVAYDQPARRELLAEVERRLETADDACFDTIVLGLSTAGVWGPNFGESWIRYLVRRIDQVSPQQRASIAVEVGEILWYRRPHHDDPRIPQAIERLLGDEQAKVRLNALSAAACLEDPARRTLIESVTNDAEPSVASRARRLIQLLDGLGVADGSAPLAPGDAPQHLKLLSRLESAPISELDLTIEDSMPPLIRLYAVRASRSSAPHDLLKVFSADEAPLRDLACVVALHRFDAEAVRDLARVLIASFEPNQRMAGAVLAGMVGTDASLLSLLRSRADQQQLDWVTRQHMLLGLAMNGEAVAGFDPAELLAHVKVPRSTVTMALLHMGRLEGLDWLLNPFGSPPVALPLLFDQLRYWHVLRRYVPDLPDFWLWAEAHVQQEQAEAVRDWYLLHRPNLKFDRERHVFTLDSAGR